MLVVIPVCEKDYGLAVRNLEHCITLDGKVDFRALIAHENGFDATSIVELAGRYFVAVDTFSYDKWTGEKTWPILQNHTWQSVARFIESKYKVAWFWWEQDAIPLKPGWLSTIQNAHIQGGQLVSGPVANLNGMTYIAGVAIYPWNTSHYYTNALLVRKTAWDIAACTKDGMLRRAHDLSSLISHTPDRVNTTFETMDDVVRHIPESAVLFHKCKDGSLLDVLQGKIASVVAPEFINNKPVPIVRDVPSFTEQTDWPNGYFAFPSGHFSNFTTYFNCSIAEKFDDLYLFTRRERVNLELITGGALQGRKNDLAIWKIRPNMTIEPHPIVPTTPNRYPHEQWEDPRAVKGEDGNTYVAFATWVHHKDWKIRQSFTRLTPDWRKIEVMWETPYGGNARKPEQAKAVEKNWIWFMHNGEWYCIYSINPMIVFKVGRDGGMVQEWKNKEVKVPWTHGLPIRGGTVPYRVGDEYYAFFHTSTVWQAPRRRYYMGAYTFSAEPPFELKRITSRPLLTGSEHDFRALGGPLVIFPNGSLLVDDNWLVVFGVNDENCGWIKIPFSALEERMEPVQRGIISRVMDAVGV